MEKCHFLYYDFKYHHSMLRQRFAYSQLAYKEIHYSEFVSQYVLGLKDQETKNDPLYFTFELFIKCCPNMQC